MKPKTLETVAFVASGFVLFFLYGYGAAVFDWYPGRFVDRAVKQTAAYFGDPHYLAPRHYDRSGARVVDASRMAEGLTLVSTHFVDWDWMPGLRLIDRTGGVVHEWRVDPAELFPGVDQVRGVDVRNRRGVHGAHLYPNGDVILNVEYLGVARLDACGNVLWSHANGAHHSLALADDGTLWLPVAGPAERPVSSAYPDGYPGLDGPVNHDRLVNIEPDGTVRSEISVLDVLYRNGLARYLAKSRPVVDTDLTHVNDVEPLPASLADTYPLLHPGDLLVSLRASDLILVLDPATEHVKWYMADPFVQPHDPDFIGDGWIGVFNNNWDDTSRGAMLGGSEILAVQPHTDSLRVLFPTTASETFYTEYLGKWQLLENENLLLTEGRTGRIVEVGPDGDTIWEWINQPFDEAHAIEITEGTRYQLNATQVAEWPCAASSGGTRKTKPE